METCPMTPDQLIRNLVSNTRDIIQCAECRALTLDAVRAGCDHVFCRKCLDHKFQSFDTEENFTYCPICKSQLLKGNITGLTSKVARLNVVLKKCVEDFCKDAALNTGTYLETEAKKPPRTYSKKRSQPSGEPSEETPKLRAKEKVEQWLMNSTDTSANNEERTLTPDNETASTESFRCSSSAQRSAVSKESYDIVPAPSPPPNDEPACSRRGRGRGRGKGQQRKSALPISSGDKPDTRRRGRSAGSTPDLNKPMDQSLNGMLSTSPTFELMHQRSATSTPLPDSTPLTAPKRRGRPTKRPQSAFSERSHVPDARADFQNKTVATFEVVDCEEEQVETIEVDLFDPSSPPRQEAPEATVNEETTSSIDKSAVAQIQEILHDIQMDVDKSPVHGSTKKVEALPNKEKDLQKTLSPSNHANVPNERSPRFIRIASPSRRDLIENQEELNKKNDNSFRELDPLESQNSSTITSPEGASSSEAHAMPDDNRSNQNQNPPSNITEVVNKTSVPSFENNAGPCERVVINFIHKSRLVPKQKKVVVHQRNVIRFVKKGKLDCRLIQQNIETHECPVVEKKSCLSKETQTESFTFRDAIVQTEELEELRVVDKTEMEIQTDNELWNSFLKEMSGVFAMEASRDAGNGSQRSREATPDVFQSVEPLEAFDRALEVCQRDVSPDVFQNVEPFKRARVPSEGNSGDENEPKRKRASFDIQQPEFQVPVASASRAPSVEEAASKTVIMESDQESDSVDVVAPTPPRKQPTPKLPPPPPKRVFTCSSLQRPQVKLVQEWAKKIGADVVPTYTPAVTHVIVQVDAENCAQRTLKFLYGVASAKWIVGVDWVQSSMRERCVADEELFEALDMEGEGGPCRSRTRSGASKLFQAFEFCCQEPFTDVTADQLRELLELCGAATTPSPAQIKKCRSHALIVVQVDDANEAEVQRRAANWFDRYRVLSVSREWVLDCLAAYKLMPIRSHLIGKHSEALLRILRFDEQLMG